MPKHPKLQNEIYFLPSSEGKLVFRSILQPYNGQSHFHFHTKISEEFKILKGELTIYKNKEVIVLKKSQKIVVHPFAHHKIYNHSKFPVEFEVSTSPPLDIKKGFEILYGLASDDRIFNNGLPKNIIHLAISLNFLDTYSSGMSLKVQKFGYKFLVELGNSLNITQKLTRKYC